MIQILIPIKIDKLEDSLFEIEKSIKQLDQKLQYKIMFISEEIFTNLARHADFEDRVADTSLVIESSDKKEFLLKFRDNSKAFNLLTYPEPKINTSIEERELGGLGIYLTKKYAKNLDYYFDSNHNILKVIL